MSAFILVIDDTTEIAPVVEAAVQGRFSNVVSVLDLGSAKRKLIASEPVLIICRVLLGSDEEAGYRFARELQGHPDLSRVPLILVANEVTEAVIRAATEVGAKTLVPWPVSPESLGYRIFPLIGEHAGAPDGAAKSAAKSSAEPAPTPPPRAAATPPATASPAQRAQSVPTPQPVTPTAGVAAGAPLTPPQSEKLNYAQQLLAKVLHNLRTSALLDVADMDDVPRIVMEMTRTVCGIKDDRRPGEPAAGKGEKARAEVKSDPSIQIDLDTVFGSKK